MKRLFLALFIGGTTLSAAADEPMAWGCASAAYFGETREYRHAVLGDDVEWKGLYSTWTGDDGEIVEGRFTLPKDMVFEDVAPRCGDFNDDGVPDPVTIVSDAQNGARVMIFVKGEIYAQNPPIGTGNRWLAPVGIADFNGDGGLDLAYVDRPHIFGMLRLWSVAEGRLEQIAELRGFSNHRIGEDFITGGVRDCGQGPEIVVPNDRWNTLMAVRYDDGGLTAVPIADQVTPAAVHNALKCED
ncbi:MAG: VCBS repeat-containing protein [Pseudomonadota bacterium]